MRKHWLIAVCVLTSESAMYGDTMIGWHWNTPFPDGETGIVAVAAGDFHVAALKENGSVVAWGYNHAGETNIPVEAQSGVVAVFAGAGNIVALKYDSTAIGWGEDSFGQMPLPAVAQTEVIAFAFGMHHAAALKDDGRVVAWGANSYGQTNVPLTAQSGVIAIAAGAFHIVALKGDGSVVAWGGNRDGQTDVPPAAQSGVIAIAAGYHCTYALKDDGRVLAWGNGFFGSADVPVAAQSGVKAIAASGNHAVALKHDGTIVNWPYEDFPPWNPPIGLRGITAIAAGIQATVALYVPSGPVITLPPLSQTVAAGQSATFTAETIGYPLSFQWTKDGVNLAGATGVTYSVESAQTNQAGNYAVIVSNIVGCVTSTPSAVLTVTTSDSNSAVSLSTRRNGNELALSWPTSSVSFKLQYTLDLTSPVTWADVSNLPSLLDARWTVTTTFSTSAQFFRLRKP